MTIYPDTFPKGLYPPQKQRRTHKDAPRFRHLLLSRKGHGGVCATRPYPTLLQGLLSPQSGADQEKAVGISGKGFMSKGVFVGRPRNCRSAKSRKAFQSTIP